ncbi:MAG: nuclease [Desulfuromonas sp.]|nr:MAG: nuclease [Desulfuromonas sp.]
MWQQTYEAPKIEGNWQLVNFSGSNAMRLFSLKQLQKTFLAAALLLFLALPCIGETFTGKVVKVTDGDTISVLHQGRPEKVRLAEIDCPERGQAFGKKSKEFASSITAGKIVRVEVRTVYRYGRTVGEVFLANGESLNRLLVKEGYAWWYRKYSSDISIGELEAEAREGKRGLWFGENPMPPWEWRSLKRQRKKYQ